MRAADGERRDFVVGFAEPLTRLAAILTAGPLSDVDAAERLAVIALARTCRRWRDAAVAPEPLAIEALLSLLPRGFAAPPAVGVEFEIGADDDPVAVRNIKVALWQAWCGLRPRHRVPIVFDDPSIVSRRLAGVEVPDGFMSTRKYGRIADAAMAEFRDALLRDERLDARLDAALAVDVDGVIAQWLPTTLAEAAGQVGSPIDVLSRVTTESRRLRWRSAVAVAVVIAVLGGGSAVAATVSQPNRKASAQPSGSPLAGQLVVDWPTRGTLTGDSELLSDVRSEFAANHPDAVGQAQVLLATDTTWFRLVYATSQTAGGVIGAWYYGPVGANSLTEGAVQRGADVSDNGVVAAAVSDPAGHTVLVVIAPPHTTEVQWADVESFSAPDPPSGVDDLANPDGITVYDVPNSFLPASRLVVHVGQAEPWSSAVPQVRLAASAVVSAGRIPVERGFADRAVLAAAVATAHRWQQTGAFGSTADAKVVWGGVDNVDDVGVVLRMASPQLSDLLVVSWSSDGGQPPRSRAYRVDAASPDTPLAFFYDGRDGARVGVIAPHGVRRVVLVVDGKPLPAEPVDDTGFASMVVQGQTGLLAEQSIAVRLVDSAGRQLPDVVTPIEPALG